MRPFAWHDLVSLFRNRRQLLALDSALELTRGNRLGVAAILANLHPEHGSFTGVVDSQHNGTSLIGQMHYRMGERSARICYLLPESACQKPLLLEMLDGMAQQAGAWGAFNLLAELEETNPVYEQLRRAGFAVYAWQRIWRFYPASEFSNGNAALWQPVQPADEISTRSLYHCLVPPLVQSAAAFPAQRLQGLVYRSNGEVLGYTEVIQGPRGIYLHPLIHPTLENAADLLACLPRCVAPLLGRSVYLAVRSYQAWLETTLQDMHLEALPRQALLVKHLVGMQRASVASLNRAVIENTRAEPTAPIMQRASRNHEKLPTAH